MASDSTDSSAVQDKYPLGGLIDAMKRLMRESQAYHRSSDAEQLDALRRIFRQAAESLTDSGLEGYKPHAAGIPITRAYTDTASKTKSVDATLAGEAMRLLIEETRERQESAWQPYRDTGFFNDRIFLVHHNSSQAQEVAVHLVFTYTNAVGELEFIAPFMVDALDPGAKTEDDELTVGYIQGQVMTYVGEIVFVGDHPKIGTQRARSRYYRLPDISYSDTAFGTIHTTIKQNPDILLTLCFVMERLEPARLPPENTKDEDADYLNALAELAQQRAEIVAGLATDPIGHLSNYEAIIRNIIGARPFKDCVFLHNSKPSRRSLSESLSNLPASLNTRQVYKDNPSFYDIHTLGVGSRVSNIAGITGPAK